MTLTLFVGNCQAQAMMLFYKAIAQEDRVGEVHYIAKTHPLNDLEKTLLRKANVIVDQVFDMKNEWEPSDLDVSAKIFEFPSVTGSYLWPYGLDPHPEFVRLGGNNVPFSGELGDRFLNQLVISGKHPNEAIDLYLDHDIVRKAHVQRRFELLMSQQENRDLRTGFSIAPLIQSYFTQEQLSYTPGHHKRRILLALTRELFPRMGFSEDECEIGAKSVYSDPLNEYECPIHPRIAEHFGLSYGLQGAKYRFGEERNITFEEYIEKYVNYSWNKDLSVGISLASAEKDLEALPLLRSGLLSDPDSAIGHLSLGYILLREGSESDAADEWRTAVELRPNDPSLHLQLGLILDRLSRFAESEISFRNAIKIHPYDSGAWVALALCLRKQGMEAESDHAFYEAMKLSPHKQSIRIEFFKQLSSEGQVDRAGDLLAKCWKNGVRNVELMMTIAKYFETTDNYELAVTCRLSIADRSRERDNEHDVISNMIEQIRAKETCLSSNDLNFSEFESFYGYAVYDFTQSSSQQKALVRGWYLPETDRVWAEGASSLVYVSLSLPSGYYVFRFLSCAYVSYPEVPVQRWVVVANGRKIGDFEDSREWNFHITQPFQVFNTEVGITIALIHENCIRPSDYENSEDSRELSVAIQSIEVISSDFLNPVAKLDSWASQRLTITESF